MGDCVLIKVDHEELDVVRNSMKTDGELLSEEITNLMSELEKLRGIWQGVDADTFYNNVLNYLTKMKSIPAYLDVVNKFISRINDKYTDNDEAFSRELNTEVDDYERNINN